MVLDVLALCRPFRTSASGPASEKLGENIPETALSLGAKIHSRKVETSRKSASESPALRPGLLLEIFRVEAVLIVHGPLFGIAQNIVGFLHLLESLFSRLVPGIDIGMIFSCHAPVRLFYLRLLGVSRNTQNSVIVFFFWHRIH